MICDEAERIRTIFLHRGDGEALAGVAFSLTRREVLKRWGTPSKSGGPSRIPVLGDKGAWDRFTLPRGLVFTFSTDWIATEIDMITLMCRREEP